MTEGDPIRGIWKRYLHYAVRLHPAMSRLPFAQSGRPYKVPSPDLFNAWVMLSGRNPLAAGYKCVHWEDWQRWIRFLWGMADQTWGPIRPHMIRPTDENTSAERALDPGTHFVEADQDAEAALEAFGRSLWRWKVYESAVLEVAGRRYPGFSMYGLASAVMKGEDPTTRCRFPDAGYVFCGRHLVKGALAMVLEKDFFEPFVGGLMCHVSVLFFGSPGRTPLPVPAQRWPMVLEAAKREAGERELSARAIFAEAVLQGVVESAGDIPSDLEVGGTWVSVAYHLQDILTERFLGSDWRREYDDLPRAGIAFVPEKYGELIADPAANVEAEVEALLEAELEGDLGTEAEAVLTGLDQQLKKLANLAQLTWSAPRKLVQRVSRFEVGFGLA